MKPEERGAALGVGSEADQLARLDHATEAHGLVVIDCVDCAGESCERCSGFGATFCYGSLEPCSPSCLLRILRTPS
jgi:hypothetical protein